MPLFGKAVRPNTAIAFTAASILPTEAKFKGPAKKKWEVRKAASWN